MNYSRIDELLNAELDSELDADELDELKRLLAEDPQAQQAREEINTLHRHLRDLPDQDMPASLHHRIVSAVQLSPTQATSERVSWLDRLLPAPTWRYGMAAAAVLAVTVALFNIGGPAMVTAPEDEVVGSMLPPRAAEAGLLVDRFSVAGPQVSGVVSLRAIDEQFLMNIQLDTTEPVDVSVDLAGTGLELEALAGASDDVVSQAGSILQLRSSGSTEINVKLRRTETATLADMAEISLEFSSAGRLLDKGHLKPAR